MVISNIKKKLKQIIEVITIHKKKSQKEIGYDVKVRHATNDYGKLIKIQAK